MKFYTLLLLISVLCVAFGEAMHAISAGGNAQLLIRGGGKKLPRGRDNKRSSLQSKYSKNSKRRNEMINRFHF